MVGFWPTMERQMKKTDDERNSLGNRWVAPFGLANIPSVRHSHPATKRVFHLSLSFFTYVFSQWYYLFSNIGVSYRCLLRTTNR